MFSRPFSLAQAQQKTIAIRAKRDTGEANYVEGHRDSATKVAP